MIIKKYLLILLTLMLLSSETVFSQSLSVNRMELNEYYRRQQLLGNIDSTISFTFRPLFSEALGTGDIFDPENNLKAVRKNSFDGIFNFDKGKGKIQLLPVSILSQFNSHHPEGINDGSMIPAKGLQIKTSTGLFFKYRFLNIKLNPEFVYAQNKSFETFPKNHKTTIGIQFPANPYLGGNIDLPERFGETAYQKAFLGESSIRLNFKPISIGISNENLWWGPGYRNSLLMTNSASGFLHLTLNTVKPIKTPIGSFETQIIGGKLEESGYTESLVEDWRYINAMVLNYQPKWIPGLFLGMTRSFMTYNTNLNWSINDCLPVLSFLTKKSNGDNTEVDNYENNQLLSLFMRWLFSESHGEIYFEFGREDHSWDLRDFILEAEHSSAYMLGARKLFVLNKSNNAHIQVLGELSHLASNLTTVRRGGGGFDRNRAYGGWYIHSKVRHGYTNKGQMLGAGIGPGSNSQTLHASWNQSLKQIGLEFERYVHNNDFWFNYIKGSKSNWVDRGVSLFANWDYRHFLFYGKMKYVNTKNYQWLYEPLLEDVIEEYWTDTDDTYNFHIQAGVTYRF